MKSLKSHFNLYLILFFSIHITMGSASVSGGNVQNGDDPSSPVVHYFYLHPVQDVLPLSLYPEIDEKEVEFKKEPDLGRGKIYRKLLLLGKDEKDYIPFAWNVKTAKLYLDFNRNFDLTDDPDNVFDVSDKDKWWKKSMHIPIERKISNPRDPNHTFVYLVDFFLRSTKNCFVSLHVTSSWKGEIDLPDIKAIMTVTDDLDGQITPPEESKSFSSDIYILNSIVLKDSSKSSTLSHYDFQKEYNIPNKIHLQNRSYNVKYDFVKESGQVILRVGFQETNPDMGTIYITGKYINRMMLLSDYQVHLFSPEAKMTIPSGTYKDVEPFLVTADSRQSFLGFPEDRFTLEKNGEYKLNMGGPLKSKIVMNHYEEYISLEYQLNGIGNEDYIHYNQGFPPQFDIYKGDRKIFSGKFNFG